MIIAKESMIATL